MAYPTTSQLVGASSVEALTGLSSAEQDSLRDAAIKAVEDHCNQSFEPEDNAAKRTSGTGAMYLLLPKRLRALDAITIDGHTVSSTLMGISDRGHKLFFQSLAGLNYYERTLRELDDQVLKFTSGVENIVVTGDWGWATVPPPVVTALRYDMEDSALAEQSELGPTVAAFRKMGLKDVQQGNLTVTMHDDAPPLSSRVRNLLTNDLIWRDPVGVVV